MAATLHAAVTRHPYLQPVLGLLKRIASAANVTGTSEPKLVLQYLPTKTYKISDSITDQYAPSTIAPPGEIGIHVLRFALVVMMLILLLAAGAASLHYKNSVSRMVANTVAERDTAQKEQQEMAKALEEARKTICEKTQALVDSASASSAVQDVLQQTKNQLQAQLDELRERYDQLHQQHEELKRRKSGKTGSAKAWILERTNGHLDAFKHNYGLHYQQVQEDVVKAKESFRKEFVPGGLDSGVFGAPSQELLNTVKDDAKAKVIVQEWQTPDLAEQEALFGGETCQPAVNLPPVVAFPLRPSAPVPFARVYPEGEGNLWTEYASRSSGKDKKESAQTTVEEEEEQVIAHSDNASHGMTNESNEHALAQREVSAEQRSDTTTEASPQQTGDGTEAHEEPTTQQQSQPGTANSERRGPSSAEPQSAPRTGEVPPAGSTPAQTSATATSTISSMAMTGPSSGSSKAGNPPIKPANCKPAELQAPKNAPTGPRSMRNSLDSRTQVGFRRQYGDVNQDHPFPLAPGRPSAHMTAMPAPPMYGPQQPAYAQPRPHAFGQQSAYPQPGEHTFGQQPGFFPVNAPQYPRYGPSFPPTPHGTPGPPQGMLPFEDAAMPPTGQGVGHGVMTPPQPALQPQPSHSLNASRWAPNNANDDLSAPVRRPQTSTSGASGGFNPQAGAFQPAFGGGSQSQQ